jgi:nucleoside-diphosphate-sugar epimerase
MRIAITGGTGNVGRAVIDLALSLGHSIVSIDRIPLDLSGKTHHISYVSPNNVSPEADITHVQADITDYDALVNAFRGCDAMVHMAAIPAPGHLPDHVVHNNNVSGSYNALRAAVEVGIERICQASSVNATGLAYSRSPRFDYFPLDEHHPTYNEEPYGLSKWICEAQADSFARRYKDLSISSLRLHWVAKDRATAEGWGTKHPDTEGMVKNLWAYTTFAASARASLLALNAPFTGHEVFYIAGPNSISTTPSMELARKFYPDVPIRGDLSGTRSFFNSSKAERMLGWKHDVE